MNREEQEKYIIKNFIEKLNHLSRELDDLRDQFIRFEEWKAQDSEFKEFP